MKDRNVSDLPIGAMSRLTFRSLRARVSPFGLMNVLILTKPPPEARYSTGILYPIRHRRPILRSSSTMGSSISLSTLPGILL